jgi:hypothetical protein
MKTPPTNGAKVPPPTYADYGKIILEKFGAERIKKGYGITDPENDLDGVGRAAISWRDINYDGTLN